MARLGVEVLGIELTEGQPDASANNANQKKPESRKSTHMKSQRREMRNIKKAALLSADALSFAATAVVGLTVAAGVLAAPAQAEYSWVGDESAGICNAMSLVHSGYSDWASIEISSLQLTQNISRSEAVAGIRQAASGYCPEYLSVVPAR